MISFRGAPAMLVALAVAAADARADALTAACAYMRRDRRSKDPTMKQHARLAALAFVVVAGIAAQTAPAAARGGGPANIINSEGYQRALREERKLYAPAQPVVPAPPPRHRHHRPPN